MGGAKLHQHGRARQADALICSVKRMVREKLFTCNNFQKQAAKDPHLTQINVLTTSQDPQLLY